MQVFVLSDVGQLKNECQGFGSVSLFVIWERLLSKGANKQPGLWTGKGCNHPWRLSPWRRDSRMFICLFTHSSFHSSFIFLLMKNLDIHKSRKNTVINFQWSTSTFTNSWPSTTHSGPSPYTHNGHYFEVNLGSIYLICKYFGVCMTIFWYNHNMITFTKNIHIEISWLGS